MFNKTKERIKNKLRNILGINHLEKRLNWLEDDNKIQHEIISKNIDHNSESIKVLHNTIENVVHIGTDVARSEYGHSWSVVCIEGKINIVKFVDLSNRDARSILGFLKQFEGGRHCIDAPMNRMMYDDLFKF